MRSALAAVALLALGGRAVAGPIHNGGDAVRGHPGMTYADLVRLAVPDLARNDADNAFEGHLPANPRHVAGAEYQGEQPDSVTLGFLEERRIKVGGQPRIALLADLGSKADRIEGLALLMLLTDTPHPKLLDEADVGVDKDSVLTDTALSLGPGDGALVTYSEHDDADLTMGGYVLISPVGDRLRLVQMFHVESVQACGWRNIEGVKFSSAPDPGRAYRKIETKVSAHFSHTDPSCGASDVPKARSATFSAAYRWNAATHRFETTSDIARRWKAFNDNVFK